MVNDGGDLMANKNQHMKTIVLSILVTISIAGAGAGYFFSDTSPTPSSSSNNSDYSSFKNQVNSLNQQVRSNPNDIPLQQDLGNAYYDLATSERRLYPGY